MAFYKTKQRSVREMIFGVRAVIEAVNAGKDVDRILFRRDMSNELSRELLAVVKGTGVPLQRVPVEKLNRLTQKNHQGVVAFISPVTYRRIGDLIPLIYEAGRSPFVVVLDGVTDVRNFGAIARTCECAGVDAIVVASKGGAPVNADAVKTSAGALLSVPVCREESLTNALRLMSDSGVKIVAATEKASSVYTDIDCTDPVALVMGSEDEGVSPEILRLCTEWASIPLLGKIGSLNVSVAAGIMIYETVRQRGIRQAGQPRGFSPS